MEVKICTNEMEALLVQCPKIAESDFIEKII